MWDLGIELVSKLFIHPVLIIPCNNNMEFKDLTDNQWEFIKPHLPPQPIVGRKRADDRKTINGILFVLFSGCRWRDIPAYYGSYVTAWRRLKKWSEEGVWERILSNIRDMAYRLGILALDVVSIDSSFVESKKGAKMSSIMDTRSEEALRSMFLLLRMVFPSV